MNVYIKPSLDVIELQAEEFLTILYSSDPSDPEIDDDPTEVYP